MLNKIKCFFGWHRKVIAFAYDTGLDGGTSYRFCKTCKKYIEVIL